MVKCNPTNDGLQGADVIAATARFGMLRPRRSGRRPAGFEQPVDHFSLQLDASAHAVKTKNTRNAVLVGLHPPFRRARPLNWRTGSAILKSLVREHRAHTAFMSAGHPAMHEVQYLGIGVAVVTRP